MSGTTLDALIVGAGPVGLSTAMLLTRMGHTVRIIERRDGPQRAPAAHVINARTFEIWRQLGIDVDRIRAHAQSPAAAGQVHWVTKLGGDVFGSLPYEQQGDDQLFITPTPLRNLSQHQLEPLLLTELAAMGTSVEYSTTWSSLDSASDSATDGDVDVVVSTITRGNASETVTSRWLLACDGSSSKVRRACGIEMEGPDNLQTFSMTHFTANLQPLVAANPGILHWICAPDSGGTLVSHGGDNEWVYMAPIEPDADTSGLTNADLEAAIRTALIDGSDDIEIEILKASSWTMTAQLAQRYRSGRVFLLGDSAHRFPPTGGMGLNTGVQDAHNLAWKLNAVMHASADDSLLDTYETERRVIAQRNTDASLENAFKMFDVFAALPTGDREAISAAIANQATHFDMLGLQMGFRYVLDESVAPLEPLSEAVIRTYTPSSQPGGRLPHGWLQRNGVTISSLDLVPLDSHVVIAGSDAETTSELPVLRLGTDFDDPNDWWGTVLALPPTATLIVRPDQHIAERNT